MHIIAAGALVFAAGTIFGIFGAGGSILLVPILVYVLNLPVKMALGMALLMLVLTGGTATLTHARARNVSWKIGLRWAAFGMIGAYIGGRLAEHIPEEILLMLFAIVVVVAATMMIRRRAPDGPRVPVTHIDMRKVVLVGTSLGFFTGLLGVGGGFLLVPAMVLACNLDVKLAIGTSLLVTALNSLGGFLGFAAHEHFPVGLTATVTTLAAVGGFVGARLAKPLPAHRLRPAFGVFLLLIGAAMAVQNLIEILGAQ
ncbi:MAG TPA: sulfite exporter TauE/SafE family protein [Candidatus Krumholzibacteria bacterium]|nr:sulfite exporter TauE/SafE family protein [Candidatus Krumholzibacteria bacterium]